jgi:Ca2+/H+ antiporter, TMEM165/GDT1 family
VLAVGTVRGWRPALVGAFLGAALLVVLVLALGPLLSRVPITWLQLTIGVLLLLFGMRWLRKAALRAAGVIALHDEAAAFAAETRLLGEAKSPRGTWDPVALVTSLKAVFVEGVEVVFIVMATGAAANALLPASFGAITALLIVVILGLTIHRPLARVPENTLKFSVGVLLSAFGVFWFGEGAGFQWLEGDLSLLALIIAFLVVGLVSVVLARRIAGLPYHSVRGD